MYAIRSYYVANEEVFASTNLTQSREETNLSSAVRILQMLTKAHLKDKTPEARIDLLNKRLNFARSHAIGRNNFV